MSDVVITGYGIKGPGISDKASFLDILRTGKCTQSVIKNGEHDLVVGMIDDDFTIINNVNYKRHPRAVRMAIAATLDAIKMTNLSDYKPERIAVILGTSAGAILEIEKHSNSAFDLKTIPIHAVSLVDSNTLSNSVAEAVGTSGPVFTVNTGCTSSVDATLLGKMLIETGVVDACIVGGTDSPLGQWTINAFNKTRSLSTETSIAEAGVPFSNQNNGFVLSEGAGILILERRQTAEELDHKIYGKIDRVVSRNEAKKLLQSDTTGRHMLKVLQDTVQDSKPSYVNSQALGLKVNDQIERFIHLETFGVDVPITSIKGMIGHSFGAMGAIQIIASLLSIEYGFIPPTIKTKGEGFEDTPIVHETTYQDVESVCVTTHSSSGNNACILLSKA